MWASTFGNATTDENLIDELYLYYSGRYFLITVALEIQTKAEYNLGLQEDSLHLQLDGAPPH